MDNSSSVKTADNLELENLKLKNENLEAKMEIQNLKYEKALSALQEENTKSREKLKKANCTTEIDHLSDQLTTPSNGEKEKEAKEDEVEEESSKTQRKITDDQNDIAKRQKQVEELSETEQKIDE